MKNVFDDGDVTSITSFATDGLKPKIFNKHDVTQWLHCIVGNLGARFWKRKNAWNKKAINLVLQNKILIVL